MVGGDVPAATIRLVAAPASLSPQFSFGCGSEDGTASCYLGEMDAKATKRQLLAQVTVPATATSVASVQLTVLASAAHLPKDPEASVTVAVETGIALGPGGTTVDTSPLPVGSLPYLTGGASGTGGQSATLSPGGNAAGLFPTLSPSPSPTSPSPSPGQRKAGASTVANTSALPLGSQVVGAQLAGLGVLALAFVLAVTRLTIRRRPATVPPAQSRPEPAKPADSDPKES